MKKRMIIAISIVIFIVLLPHILHLTLSLLLSDSPYAACWNGTIVEKESSGYIIEFDKGYTLQLYSGYKTLCFNEYGWIVSFESYQEGDLITYFGNNAVTYNELADKDGNKIGYEQLQPAYIIWKR